jgi:hypothetical protein
MALTNTLDYYDTAAKGFIVKALVRKARVFVAGNIVSQVRYLLGPLWLSSKAWENK